MAKQQVHQQSKTNKKKKAKGKRFLDGISVGVSLPGSKNTVTGGPTRGGDFAIASRGVRSAPVALTSAIKTRSPKMTMTKDGAIIAGRDLLTQITVASHNAGDVRYTIPITPFMVANSRLGVAAQIFEKFRVRKLIFSYATTVPTSQAGQLIHFIDYDVTNTMAAAAPTNMSIAAAHTHSAPFAVWTNSNLSYGKNPQWLFTYGGGDDDRWDSAGLYTVVCASNFTSTASLGNVYVEYEFEFLQGQAALPGSGLVTNGAIGTGAGGSLAAPAGATLSWQANFLNVKYSLVDSLSTFDFPKQAGGEKYLFLLNMKFSTALAATPTPAIVTRDCLKVAWTGTLDVLAAGSTSGTLVSPGISGSSGPWTYASMWCQIVANTNVSPRIQVYVANGTGGGTVSSTVYIIPINAVPLSVMGRSSKLKSVEARLEQENTALRNEHLKLQEQVNALQEALNGWGLISDGEVKKRTPIMMLPQHSTPTPA